MNQPIFLLRLFCLLLLPFPGFSQWAGDPVNTPVCTAPFAQQYAAPVTDGQGGIIVAWSDRRVNTLSSDVYAQRITADGIIKWTVDGVVVCSAPGEQRSVAVIEDGQGGAFLAWEDQRLVNGTQIYIQHIDSTGSPVWANGGVVVAGTTVNRYGMKMCKDGFGGVILAWTTGSLWAQRVSAAGTMLWAANGVVVAGGSGYKEFQAQVPDGSGGAIFCWQDDRSAVTGYDIYAQRLNASGTAQWLANGIPISTMSGDQWYCNMVPGNAGGALIFWSSRYSSSTFRLYAQKVDNNGTLYLPVNGKMVIDSTVYFQNYVIPDIAGGCFVGWADYRNAATTSIDIYAQRFDSSANALWADNGILICNATGNQAGAGMCRNNNGDLMISWSDNRTYAATNADIYAQKVSASGSIVWTPNGIPVSTASNEQSSPSLVASDNDGAIAVWEDWRNAAAGNTTDVYASKILANGTLPLTLTGFTALLEGTTAVRLQWSTADEKEVAGFEVQRSLDGDNFYTIQELAATGKAANHYQARDEDLQALLQYDFFYRLKMNDQDGKVAYSQVRRIGRQRNATEGMRTLWPNPVTGDQLFFNGREAVRADILTIDGKNISDFILEGRNTIRFTSGLKPGLYTVIFHDEDGTTDRYLFVKAH